MTARTRPAARDRRVADHCRVCESYVGCRGDCPGISRAEHEAHQAARRRRAEACFERAENRRGSIDAETGLMNDELLHTANGRSRPIPDRPAAGIPDAVEAGAGRSGAPRPTPS